MKKNALGSGHNCANCTGTCRSRLSPEVKGNKAKVQKAVVTALNQAFPPQRLTGTSKYASVHPVVHRAHAYDAAANKQREDAAARIK